MTQALSTSSIVVASSEHVSTPMNQETVLLHLQNGKHLSLNRVGCVVWEHVQQETSVASVVDVIMEQFEVDRSRCESDVLRILESLSSAGLIEFRQDPSSTRAQDE